MKIFEQTSPQDSPWDFKTKVRILLWEYVWALLCSWTPKPFNFWRLFILKLFGCKISGRPFVHQRARIALPWNLVLHDRACLGDRANAYSLGVIEIRMNAVVAQEAYLCTGTHAFMRPQMNLMTSPIIVGEGAFVGARAFVLPGVTIGDGAVVGACSVVTKNVSHNSVVAGNPATLITAWKSTTRVPIGSGN
ncbi:MAG: putative colanic acid biosynthesis acetyltransferase [bacterium]|nr:putative colanic acid biosynthesis acetyltransferase [bacterium]